MKTLNTEVLKNPVPNPSISAEFCQLLTGEHDPEITVQTIADSKALRSTVKPQFHHGRYSELAPTLGKLNQNGHGIFATLNPTDGKGRKQTNIVRVRALAADLDGADLEAALKVLEESEITPHITVQTSPGKYHLYILVHNFPRAKFKTLQRALAKATGGDISVCDLPRVLRMPGFLHLKNEPFLSTILESSDHPKYSYHEIAEKLAGYINTTLPTAQNDSVFDINHPLKDGERTNGLTSLCGYLIHLGADRGTSLSIIRAWNQHNQPPLPEDKLIKTYDSIVKTDQNNLATQDPVYCELASRYVPVKNGGKTAVYDKKDRDLMSFEDFRKYHSNRPPVGDQTAANHFLNHPRARRKTLVFEPGKAVNEDQFNLWEGFSYEPKQGDCSKLLEHVFTNICSENQAYFDYLLDLLANIVQNPTARPGVAVVLIGEQGTGKNVFIEAFGSLFGVHYKELTNPDHALGKFNAALSSCLVLFLNEAFWGGKKDQEGALKALITDPCITVERKFHDTVPMKNHLNVFMATNNKWAVPSAAEERRYLVMEVGKKHKQDHDYFKAIVEELNNGGREALLSLLLERDISGSNLRNVPKTDALMSQKELSMGPVEEWLYNCLQRGSIQAHHTVWQLLISNSDIFESFNVMMGTKCKYQVQSAFFRELGKLIPEISKSKPTVDGQRTPSRKFPPLKKCREIFERRFGQPIDWDDVIDPTDVQDTALKNQNFSA